MRGITDEIQCIETLQKGGDFCLTVKPVNNQKIPRSEDLADILTEYPEPPKSYLAFAAMPSIREMTNRVSDIV